ncbi:MAG: hypothetical protein Kow00123_20700 [Anaerolineales bacterium]
MAIRGIFFDAAGVLYRRPESTNLFVLKLLEREGIVPRPVDAFRDRLGALRADANNGVITPDEYWDAVLEMYGAGDPNLRKALVAEINAHSDAVEEIPGARQALATLKQRGFRLGIVTDTIYPLERKRRWLDSLGLSPLVDVLACSTDVGAHKPDPAIYLRALEMAGLTPGESAFVGHDAEELEGARKAGMTTVAVNYDRDARADYYAATPLDLLDLPIFKDHARLEGDMERDIEVIFIDVGATLRVLVEDEEYQAEARRRIAELVGTQESPEAFCAELDKRYKTYRKWAFETLNEASERELWTRWLLPDYPEEKIAPLAGELTFLYRQTMGRRFAQPDAKDVVLELTRRGYRLGIISNTITEREIPQWLEEDGLKPYFPTVVLSSIFGRRKPGPEIYLEGARRAGVEPARAAYVGDNPTRDVEGARKAGFGMVILLLDPAEADEPIAEENKPDYVIRRLSDLLDIFPPRQAAQAAS